MKCLSLLLIVLLAVVAMGEVYVTPRRMTYSIKVHKVGNTCEILNKGLGQVHRLLKNEDDIIVNKRGQSILEHHPMIELGEIIEVFGNPIKAMGYLQEVEDCVFVYVDREPEVNVADEVRQLVISGPATNRIDVVFMGDGYTLNERELHFADMLRLTTDMFNGRTFSSYLPVFNIWAVHRESAESGIGYYSTPSNTAFGLYRDGTELRGVYCSKPNTAREVCRLTGTGACDFPSLIGNDPYYGGLGGEFTISTSSPTSGTMVLRHEFGHNFGDVGEEYDGGSVYSGANSDRTFGTKWSHWWTDPNYQGPEDNALRVQDYAWYDLANGPYTITFTSNGQYDRWFMRFSASGCEAPGSLVVTIDGQVLPWNTTGLLDRGFYEYYRAGGFSSGTHRLVFSSGYPPDHGWIRQLCSISLIEYKNESAYHFDNNYIGAYPTFRLGNILAGYRPNNELCLMRNMSSEVFCPVCVENNWHEFFARISLFDDVTVETSGSIVTVTAHLVPLAQLREGGALPGENYVVTWRQNGVVRSDLSNRFSFSEALTTARGTWTVTAQYQTLEVRVDPNGLLTDSESFVIS
jgi:hypothetical protein